MIPGRKFSSTMSASAASWSISVAAPGRAEIDADRPLAGVLLREVARQVVDLAADVPGHVALGWLDLDHVGAEVGQHPADERPGEDAGEVEHLDAGQRIRHDGPISRCMALPPRWSARRHYAAVT